ncbi:MAG: hypothetical protein ACLFP6_07610 [Spirochaetaceae bacterium]
MRPETEAWLDRFWIGPSQKMIPEGYQPLFGIKLVASTNNYEEPGMGAEGLAVEVMKPARTLSANRVLWEEDGRPGSLGECSRDLMKAFSIWTHRYCRGNTAMMARVTTLFLEIFGEEDWEQRVEAIDETIDNYLRGALERLLTPESHAAVTTLGDRILEIDDVLSMHFSIFGFLALKENPPSEG